MGSKHQHTDRARQQLELSKFEKEISLWYNVDNLTLFEIIAKLSTLNINVTIGQLSYAIRCFGFTRKRNARTQKFLDSIKNRVVPNKVCKHCKNVYEAKSNRQVFCHECVLTTSDIRRIRNYKVGQREFNSMFLRQGGVCGICHVALDKSEAAVDHNHVTGTVRGLLCRICNLKLSVVEDKQFVTNAQTYLVNFDPNK